MEESTKVVVEALPDEASDRAEARLRAWLDEDQAASDRLAWDYLDEDDPQPEIAGPGELLHDFDEQFRNPTVPIDDEADA